MDLNIANKCGAIIRSGARDGGDRAMVSQYLTYRQQRAAVLPARVDGVVVAVAADGVPQLGQLGVGVPGRGRVDPRVVAVDGAHRVAAGEGEGQH